MLEKIKKLMAEGKSNKEIIEKLGLTEEDLENLRAESGGDKTSDAFLGIKKPKDVTKKAKQNEEDDDMKKKGKKDHMDEQDDDDDDDDDDSDDDDDDSDDDDKKKKDNPFKKEEIELVQIATSDLEVDDEVAGLLGNDETLSEETREKTRVLFETAVVNTVNKQLEKLQEQYTELLQKQLEEKSDELVDQVDAYMDHVVESWMKDNKLAIENGIRTELAESLIKDIKEVFENHQIDIPESEVSSLEEIGEINSELEAKLDEEIKTNIELKKELTEMKKKDIMAKISDNLTESEIDKLNGMIAHVTYEDDKQYLNSVATIKESMFDKKTDKTVLTEEQEDLDLAGTNKDLEDDNKKDKSNKVNLSYAEAISRSVKH